MRRNATVTLALVAAGLIGSACTAGGGAASTAPSTLDTSASHEPVTITMWSEWTDPRQTEQFESIFDGFTAQYPWITVKDVPGQDDDKILSAISGGNPPDAVLSFGLDNVAKFCESGAWVDLTPYIEQDQLDLGQFPPAVFKYTKYAGSQCAFPFLTDAYGLYYNKDMLAAKGFTDPPKTMTELTEMAKALTEFNADGSIKVAGLVPWVGYYETNPVTYGVPWNAQFYDETNTKSALATDPQWAKYLTWQKDLVDFYGADNLNQFVAGQGDEFSSAQDFETGRIAMNMDGEWRVAFIDDEAPDLNYGTAPFPVPDDQADKYGRGYLSGTIIGIAATSQKQNAAWELTKYLTTDTAAVVSFANAIKNVPSTFDALNSPQLETTPQFKTFLDISANPNSNTTPATSNGGAFQLTLQDVGYLNEAGKISNLPAALAKADQQIDKDIEKVK